VQVRGFWGDIINSPYHAFGTTTDVQDWARLFKISGSQYRHTETDVAEFNVIGLISEMDTGDAYHLPPETSEEHEFPYHSPLETMKQQDIAEEVVDVPESIAEPSAPHALPMRAGRDRVAVAAMATASRRAAKKTEADFAALSPGFEGVEVVLLAGDVRETLWKPKYRGFFHRAAVGSLAMLPIFEELEITRRAGPVGNPERRVRRVPRFDAPEEFGRLACESSLAAVMAPGAQVLFETMKYQAHFDGHTKLGFRHRLAQVGHLVGWDLCDERHAVPPLEADVKEKRARELDRDATDFIRFVVNTTPLPVPAA